jgi:hypothetical protein
MSGRSSIGLQASSQECVNQAEDALFKSGMRIYQRAGLLVRVVRARHAERAPLQAPAARDRSASSWSTRLISSRH